VHTILQPMPTPFLGFNRLYFGETFEVSDLVRLFKNSLNIKLELIPSIVSPAALEIYRKAFESFFPLPLAHVQSVDFPHAAS